MPRDLLLAPLPLVVLGIAAAVLAWDVALAGWIAARREAPRLFTHLTAFCGLLVVPTVVIGVATGTEAGARTISGITWLLPLVAVVFALQVLFALGARLVSLLVGVPLLLYDLLLAAISIGDYLTVQRGVAPEALQAAVAARDSIVGITVGRAALVSPLTALVPILAPAFPARWRLSGVARAVLVLAATALTTLLVIEWPRGVAAIRSYEAASTEPMQARPAGDFLVGVRLLPVLGGAPPAGAIRADLPLVDAFAPDVVLVLLDDEGTRAAALDSLARVLEPLRSDSLRLAVGLRLGNGARATALSPRLQALERVLRTLKPNVVFPALADPLPAWFAAPPPPAAWWRTLLILSATKVQALRPRTALGWSAARLDAVDSSVYRWAVGPNSPVELVGAMIYPSFSGLPAVDARLRALDRWHAGARAADAAARPHWLVNVGGLPHAHGDAAQTAAIRRALAWGSRRSWIGAAIVGEPADYTGWIGLRAANGRRRGAIESIGLAARRMREARIPR